MVRNPSPYIQIFRAVSSGLLWFFSLSWIVFKLTGLIFNSESILFRVVRVKYRKYNVFVMIWESHNVNIFYAFSMRISTSIKLSIISLLKWIRFRSYLTINCQQTICVTKKYLFWSGVEKLFKIIKQYLTKKTSAWPEHKYKREASQQLHLEYKLLNNSLTILG